MTSPSSASVCTRSAASRVSRPCRWPATRSNLHCPMRASPGKTSSSPSAAAGPWLTRTQSSAWSDSPAFPSPTCSTPAPPRPARRSCAPTAIRLGDYDIGIAVGMDKHPRGAFTEDPALVGMPSWYAQNGQYLTTQFFGMKANRYLHDHGISTATLAKVAAKNFRNGVLNPNAFRRKADLRRGHPGFAGPELPADPIHVLRTRRRRRCRRDVPCRHRAPLHQ